ncbi:hypothetical protein D3C73_1460090 [compost metagenome]
MHCLRLLWRRSFASTYGPDRLVGNNAFSQILNTNSLQYRAQLTSDDPFRFAALTLSKCFADTQNRNEPSSKRRSKFLCHKVIVL